MATSCMGLAPFAVPSDEESISTVSPSSVAALKWNGALTRSIETRIVTGF
jgi:hypothetical protein